MTLTTAAGWLIGLGAVLGAARRLLGGPPPTFGMSFGRGVARRDRLDFAAEATSLVLAALGSVLLAVANFPSAWFVVALLGGAALFAYFLLAWRLHEFWRERYREAREQLHGDQGSRLAQWHVDCAHRCATWRWSLRHPLHDGWWPKDCERALGSPGPSSFTAPDHPVLEAKTRQTQPNVARVEPGDLPEWLRYVGIAAHEGVELLQTDLLVLFFAPGSLDNVVATKRSPRWPIRRWRSRQLERRLAALA